MADSKSIMIVDDSRVSRMMVRAIVLERFPDAEILEAESGVAALEVAKSRAHGIDLMILDFNMPGMDGLALAIQLKEIFPKAYMSLLTANIQDSIKDRAKEMGIGFQRKPITVERILRILDKMAD